MRSKAGLTSALLGTLLGAFTLASSGAVAQSYPPPPPPPAPQDYGQPPAGYYGNAQAPDPLAAPEGYDGSELPPPPPGYQASGDYRADAEQDRRYEAYAEDWSQRYCVKARSNAGAGAVIGGLFGALLGSSVSGRHDHGTGALVGGLAGAAGGAAVGSTTANATSPGCPPGFVVRNDAPAFYYGGYGAPYYYAAPDWYRPWYFYEGRWTYRPYPYHGWYYRNYGYGRGYGYGYGRGYGYGGYRHRRF